MKKQKKMAIDMFYNSHLKVKEIAKKLKITSACVSQFIKQDTRYIQEKEYRKSISKTKYKVAHNKLVKTQRDNKKIEDNYSIVQLQHKQAVNELSKASHLTNENYRKWNYSAYKYNPVKRRYEFDESLGRSHDVPKYIKERE